MISAKYLKNPKGVKPMNEEDRVSEATIGDLISFSNGLELKNPRFNCYIFTRSSSQPDVFLPPDVVRMLEVITAGYNFGVGITRDGKIRIRVFVGDRTGEFLVDLLGLKKVMNVYVVKDCRANTRIIEELKARLG